MKSFRLESENERDQMEDPKSSMTEQTQKKEEARFYTIPSISHSKTPVPVVSFFSFKDLRPLFQQKKKSNRILSLAAQSSCCCFWFQLLFFFRSLLPFLWQRCMNEWMDGGDKKWKHLWVCVCVRREEEPHKALSNTPGSGVLVNRAIRTEGVISTVSASFLPRFQPLHFHGAFRWVRRKKIVRALKRENKGEEEEGK